MSYDQLSHFDEKSGVVAFTTPWGRWWQTVHEVNIEVDLPAGTKSKQVVVTVKPKNIICQVHDQDIFMGRLFNTVHADETVWTIDDKSTLTIVLSKTNPAMKEELWEALLEDGGFQADPRTLHEMRKKMDLEKFQIENPGFDFSRAKLQKCYDQMPGWSTEALKGKAVENSEEQSS